MNEDEMKAAVQSWLAEDQMQAVRDYVSRGRSLERVPTDQLNSEWAGLMRDWAANPRQPINPRRTDIEAELTLRGLEPPYKLAKDDIDALGKAAADVAERMSEDEQDKILNEFADFIEREKSQTN
jgi:hypothetical protein